MNKHKDASKFGESIICTSCCRSWSAHEAPPLCIRPSTVEFISTAVVGVLVAVGIVLLLGAGVL